MEILVGDGEMIMPQMPEGGFKQIKPGGGWSLHSWGTFF